jgi:glycosyltransferase involved in cell wall biosynthesis/O-antigen/teichoic acid export membrane protein
MNDSESTQTPSSAPRSHWPLTVFSSLSAVCNLALPLVLVRVFDAEAVGHYKLFFLYLVLMPWLTLSAGITNGLYHWGGKTEYRPYFQTSWSILLCWSALISFVLFFFLKGPVFGTWFVAATFLTLLGTFHEEALIASGRTWRGGLFAASFDIVRTAVVLAVAIYTVNLDLLFKAYAITLGFKVVSGYYYGRKLDIQLWKNPFERDSQITRKTLLYAFPVSIAAMIAVFTHYADQFAVSYFTDAVYFAGYALGCLSIPPLSSLEQSINRVLIPTLRKDTPRLLRDGIAELSWILIPATVGLLIFAHPIVEMIFTTKYAWVSIFLRFYAFSYLLTIFPYDAWPRANGDGKWILKNLLISLGVAALTIPVLTWYYQGVGALIGLLACQLSLRIGGMIYIRISTEWKVRDYIPFSEIGYQAMVCTILTIACYLAGLALGHGVKWFLICAPVFALIYLSLTTRRRLTRHFKEREKPAVLQLTQYLEMGGLERIIYSLCTAYQKSNLINSFVMSYDTRPDSKSLRAEFEALHLSVTTVTKNSGFSFKALITLIRLCYREKIAVIHTHDLGPLLYAAVAKVLTFGALRIVHTQHSFVHLSKKRRHRLYEQIFTRFADALIVISPDAKKTYLELGVRESRMQMVSNGVFFPESVPTTLESKRQLRQQLSSFVDPDRYWILYLARIHSQKGQVHALHWLSHLPEEIRDRVIMVFVGQESSSGELKKLASLIESKNLAESTYFAGVSTQPLPWLQVADAFISLSEFEGMPLSPIEAYGSGLPLIVSKIPGHELLPVDTTWVDLPTDRASNRNDTKFIEMVRQPSEKIVADRIAAFERAAPWRQRYGIEQMATQYLAIYEDVR